MALVSDSDIIKTSETWAKSLKILDTCVHSYESFHSLCWALVELFWNGVTAVIYSCCKE